jgi:DNA-binding transcriptional regulator YdaS (Cro superfamily)
MTEYPSDTPKGRPKGKPGKKSQRGDAAQRTPRTPRSRVPSESAVITNGDPIPPAPREPPSPEDEQKVIARGTLMALLVQEVGSYVAVAELFGVKPSTVRYWVHETRKRKPEQIQKIADRLQSDVAQLAVDRVVEGLTEGETMFAADLGRRVLHGLGALRNHTSLKTDGPTAVTSLTLNINTPPEFALRPADIIDGSIMGRPRELAADVVDDTGPTDG